MCRDVSCKFYSTCRLMHFLSNYFCVVSKVFRKADKCTMADGGALEVIISMVSLRGEYFAGQLKSSQEQKGILRGKFIA